MHWQSLQLIASFILQTSPFCWIYTKSSKSSSLYHHLSWRGQGGASFRCIRPNVLHGRENIERACTTTAGRHCGWVPSTFMGCRAEANTFSLSPNNGAEVFKAICKGARNIAVVVPSRGFSGTVARFNCLVAKVPLNPLLGTRSGGELTCAAQ